jgi:hypothetical protein
MANQRIYNLRIIAMSFVENLLLGTIDFVIKKKLLFKKLVRLTKS